MSATATFSEHWHRVANQRLSLRPTIDMHKRWFGDEKWFVVLDPLNNHFFRITPGAHAFLSRLDGRATVQQIWEAALTADPDGAPGQEEVIQLLSQLWQSNLIRGEIPADNARVFDRYKKRRKRELKTLLNVMFLRIPLLDPDAFLKRTLPLVKWLMSPVGALLWIVVLFAAVKAALDHAPQLLEQSQAVLAPPNLPLLYAALVLIKTLHEFGHAYACRRLGGEVHQMGIAFMYFSPIPYVDATSSWGFRSKWKRIFVASAGMIVELFVAAIAAFVWVSTGEGVLHSLAYNMMFVASVSTILFNANPLMRYDGYYILGDLIEIPNLQQRSMLMLRHIAEKYLFGLRKSEPPTQARGEGAFLAFFGVAGWIYRLFLGVVIALFISQHFLLLGVILALICVYSFTVKPLIGLVVYLASNARLGRNRRRAVLVTATALGSILLFLGTWPAPSRFRAPGVLRAEEYSELFTSTPGVLNRILADPGATVKKGQPLLQLASRELELEYAAARAALAQVIAQEERALEGAASDLGPIRSRREAAEKRMRRLEQQQRGLTVIAPHNGTWVAHRVEDSVGQWFPRGHLIGRIVQADQFRFSAVIGQDEAAALFSGDMRHSEVRLRGQADAPLRISAVQVIPGQQEMLPSSALGWAAGGEIEVSQRDPEGRRAAEPFFELRAILADGAAAQLLHGRSGKIRIELRRTPYLAQWYRKTRQLFQRRYQI